MSEQNKLSDDFAQGSIAKKLVKFMIPVLGGGILFVIAYISFLILCSIVNNIGLEASSGYGIAQKVINFVMLIPSALM